MDVNNRPYREATVLSLVAGILIGIVLVAAITYSSLVIGFAIVGSTISAIIGYGVIKGLFRRGTIVENNILQTIASSLNVASSGVCFTVPVLFLQGRDFNPVLMCLACMAGSFLGFFFIIPLRKQMIDLERLRFPSGVAVAAILKSPGAGKRKLVLLGVGIVVSAIFRLVVVECDVKYVDLNKLLTFIPKHFDNVWALSLMSLGAGYLTGRSGFLVLIGGILSYWIVTPITINNGWLDVGAVDALLKTSEEPISRIEAMLMVCHKEITRPMGIGMLVGGAIMGIVISMPAIAAAFRNLMRSKLEASTEEMPFAMVWVGVGVSFCLLLTISIITGGAQLPLWQSALISAVGTLWLALAGVVISQCCGMTDWSPISGISMMGVVIALWISGMNVVVGVTIGAAICMALSQCSDIMQDLKTGFLVGAKPYRQQVMQLAVTWIGPIIAMAVLFLLQQNNEIGSKQLPAPQAVALNGTIETLQKDAFEVPKYIGGLTIGGLLSCFGVPGLGVLVGLSMYLPIMYILPYGVGCLINLGVMKFKGSHFSEENGLPIAAGFIVGEAVIEVFIALFKVLMG